MRKIKTFTFVSLDGYIARIDGDVDWRMKFTRREDYALAEFNQSVDSVVMNRNHYNLLQSYDVRWPFGDLNCYVITDRLFAYPPDRSFHFWLETGRIPNAFLHDLEQLRQSEGKDILLAGDHKLTSLLIDKNLVDEITFITLHITLGNGIPFAGPNARITRWELTDHKVYHNGAVKTTYKKRGTE